MYAGATPTKFGRYAVPEPMLLDRVHFHDGSSPLREVDHEPPIGVLDQEDLHAQGIYVSSLVPGAKDADALGSCTCNAGTASVAERVAAVKGKAALADLQLRIGSAAPVNVSLSSTTESERFAIVLYHDVTDQTGDPSQEWPPTDCGSTGLYVCTELEKKGFTRGHKAATNITALVSLLQTGTVIDGKPWFNAWMEPNSQGFIDGTGSIDDLQRAISSGVAGGHETCISAVERLTFTGTGEIDPFQSHVRVRNSWSAAFGDNGSYRIHLSTYAMLGGYVDFKQFVV